MTMGYAQQILATESQGELTIDIDQAAGLVRVTGRGFWSPLHADHHFSRLDGVLRGIRMAGLRVRVLVDLREAAVQPAETIERISRATQEVYQPGDRVAIVVGSSLAKMQMRRIVRAANHDFFVSPSAAEMWLHAWK
jgi:hypothetical protein